MRSIGTGNVDWPTARERLRLRAGDHCGRPFEAEAGCTAVDGGEGKEPDTSCGVNNSLR